MITKKITNQISEEWRILSKWFDDEKGLLLNFHIYIKKIENHASTLKLNIFVSESHRKLKLDSIELYGNTE